MPTQAKRENIDELVGLLKKTNAVYIVEYRGLTVAQSTALRKSIREAGGEMKVCKNTLMRIALKENDMITAPEIDFGPNGYVLSYGDASAVAKAIRDFAKAKENAALIVKGGIFEGRIISKAEVFAIADIPPREVLLGMAVRAMASPLQGLVNVLSGPARGLVTALAAIKDKKENAA